MAEDNPIRILFIEDLPSDMELAERKLRHESIPFTSLRVETREEFQKALDEFQPDLIISDYALPEFDGMQALKLSNEYDPSLPFIILTGSMNEETAVACMKAGATDYVIKEHIKRLPYVVQEALEQKKNRAEKDQAEQTLRESEERYRVLFESINDAVFVHYVEEAGTPGGFSQVNDVACKRLGYTREELLALTPRDITTPEAYEIISAAREMLVSTGEVIIETVHVTKDGNKIPTESSVRLFNYLGKQAAISIARDITKRKRAEEELRESLERFQLANFATFNAIWDWDLKTDALWWNVNFKKLFGYLAEEIEPGIESWTSRIHPEDLGRVEASTHAAIDSGQQYWSDQYRFRLKDGMYADVEDRGYIARDASGNPVRMIGAMQDITERKRAEEAIVWMAQEWKRTFDSMSEAIWILDKDFRVLRSNKTAEHIFNRPCAEMVGKYCWEIVHGTTQPIPECPIIRAKKSLHHESQELQIGESCFEINVDPFLNKDGQLVGAVHVVRDITERKRAEEEKEKLRAQLIQSQKIKTVGLLAGGIAHDFNNILAAIIGYADLLQTEMNKADPLYSHVEHILSSSERAATLVHSLLAFSRKQTLSVKQVKINDLVSGVSKLLVRLLGEDIILETVFTFSDPRVMADAGQIDQILFNLATNARDAMHEGGHLTITTDITVIDDTYIKEHGYGAAGYYALITVSDTGAGMDKATQGKIFEPFFTTKEVGKGTGLGLSTAYGIVKQHNGFINCYSEPGTGTTFKIYLPLMESDKEAVVEQTGNITELMPGGNETILVAEDDATVRELIKNILSQYGYTVYEAEDGEQAVQVFTEHAQAIDLLLFDVIMPRKNGKQAYREIHNIRPGVPVIFTSGYTADIIHKKGFLEEGFELLLKPVSMTALLQKVREVLDRSMGESVSR